MDQAIQTFCELMGMTLVLRHPGTGAVQEIAFVEEPLTGHRMELILKPDARSGELDHIAFEVDDVDSAFAILRSRGLHAVDEPLDVPEGAFLLEKVHSRSCRLANLLDANDLKVQIIRYDDRGR